jgi:hypothetical protein
MTEVKNVEWMDGLVFIRTNQEILTSRQILTFKPRRGEFVMGLGMGNAVFHT